METAPPSTVQPRFSAAPKSVRSAQLEMGMALESPELAAVAWALAALRGVDVPGSVAEPLSPRWRRTPEQAFELIALGGKFLGAFQTVGLFRSEDAEHRLVDLDILTARGRRYVLRCRLEKDAPHGLVSWKLGPPLGNGVRVREATEDDERALAEVERNSFIQSANGSRVVVDRGAHHWDHLELMDGNRIFVVEVEGEVVAMAGASVRPARIDGVDYLLSYCHGDRVLPSHQGSGVYLPLTSARMEAPLPDTDGYQGYIDANNEKVLALARTAGTLWTPQAKRLLFDVRRLAKQAVTRRATAQDAGRIADIMNGCHEREAMFLPYTEESLQSRLSRRPNYYSWSDVSISDHAVLGIAQGAERRVRTHADGALEIKDRALAFDHGFVGETGFAEFEELLRARCAELAESGVTHISLTTCEGSPGHDKLVALADSVEEYRINCFVKQPDVSGGVFVDQLYF